MIESNINININKIPDYDIEKINLKSYNQETRNIILSNLKKYTKLINFSCHGLDLTELPELPDSLIELDCSYNKFVKLPNLPN